MNVNKATLIACKIVLTQTVATIVVAQPVMFWMLMGAHATILMSVNRKLPTTAPTNVLIYKAAFSADAEAGTNFKKTGSLVKKALVSTKR